MSGAVVRVASGTQVADAGALTARAYLADRLVDGSHPYADELRDAQRRAREATLLVALLPRATSDDASGSSDAVGADGPAVVGTVTLAPYGTSYAQIAEPGELEIRMLAVTPEARRRGIAELLMTTALREAVAGGARRVVLSTTDAMHAAHSLYERLGFVAVPQRDWGHVEVHLRVHAWTPPDAPGALVESATWPPARVVDVDGWRVGLSGGLTRRANSALPLGVPQDLPATLTRVEQLYAGEGQPSIVRVCRASPPGLDDVLAARDYAVMSRTDVLVRPLDGLGPGGGALRTAEGPVRVGVADRPDDEWLAAWSGSKARLHATGAAAQADDESLRLAREVLGGAPALYLTATDATGLVGVVRAAFAQDWVGLSCLVVAPRARRHGLGRGLTLRALDEAVQRGADRAFLQVEARNTAAGALYASLGFQPAERYVYRERG
ncbi:GNAT family N-acetyltransferase [Cellulomonas fengjieae]|uniref:GNAT family N-acetyltransferase n=1 Tax=Cellulomonas fengjieae TaxID=2819978 RepID=UPI001AAEA555|nr:GNAT family N-acetyltransferase [Cellulomonas fengjieae]MBO3103853.1 GNAT family N-acetyltransferase [Cellulomonas fengjieae]